MILRALDLDASPASPGAARRFVEQVLREGGDDDLTDVAALLVSELVTNALLYSRSRVRVRVSHTPAAVRVEVADDNPVLPTPRGHDDLALTGRGLGLVETLASAWGAEPIGAGKIVWFELRRSGHAEERIPICLQGVPVREYRRMQQHNRALLRELALIDADDRPDAAVPRRVLALAEELRERFSDDASAARDAIEATGGREDAVVDLVWHLPRTFAHTARELADLLDEADDLCRTGALLTLEAPSDLAAFRRWYLSEMADQIEGRAATPWRDATETTTTIGQVPSLLRGATELLRGVGQTGAVLDVLARLPIPDLADACIVHTVGDSHTADDGHAGAVVVAAEPGIEEALGAAGRPHDLPPLAKAAAASAEAQLGPAAGPALWDSLGADHAAVAAAGVRSALAVPLRSRGQVIGVMTLLTAGSHRVLRRRDIAAAQRYADQAGPVLEVARDAGQRRQAATDASHAAALLESVLWTAPVGLAFFDTSLRYMMVNDTLAEINGVPAEDHIGRTVPEVLTGMSGDVPRDLQRVLETGVAVTDREVAGETPAAPGEPRHWLASYYPIRTDDGVLFAIGAVIVEITDRHRAEEERARLLDGERRARAQLETSQRRLAFLAEASRALASTLDPTEIVHQLSALVVPDLADSCAAYLVEHGELLLVAEADADRGVGATMGPLASQRVRSRNRLFAQLLATGEPLVLGDVSDELVQAMADGDDHLEALRAMRLRSVLGVPLVSRNRVLGVLALMMTDHSGRRFDEGDLPFVEDLAGRAAGAIENALLYRRRSEEARLLQERLLPPRLPDIPRLEVAARYHPVGEGAEVGGDFYDVFRASSGRWTVVIGDVCGKGVAAASLTALARYTVRAAALHESLPSELLRILNQTILDADVDERFCTIAILNVVPAEAGARLSLAVGGHPPPLLVSARGKVRAMGRPGTAIGLFPDPQLVDEYGDLGPGDAVVLYTDGVTEARATDGTFFEARLIETLERAAGADADELADAVERAVLAFQGGQPRDDIAIVVVRVPPA